MPASRSCLICSTLSATNKARVDSWLACGARFQPTPAAVDKKLPTSTDLSIGAPCPEPARAGRRAILAEAPLQRKARKTSARRNSGPPGFRLHPCAPHEPRRIARQRARKGRLSKNAPFVILSGAPQARSRRISAGRAAVGRSFDSLRSLRMTERGETV